MLNATYTLETVDIVQMKSYRVCDFLQSPEERFSVFQLVVLVQLLKTSLFVSYEVEPELKPKNDHDEAFSSLKSQVSFSGVGATE